MKTDKLVRDKVPEMITNQGNTPVIHIATASEYWQKLKNKLIEEAREFQKDENIEEFVDILEVLDAIAEYKKFEQEEVAKIKNYKLLKNGGFKNKIILEKY